MTNQKIVITLETTGEIRQPRLFELYLFSSCVYQKLDSIQLLCDVPILRQVNETAIPLTKEETYLRLNADDCKSIFGCSFDLMQRVTEFIKDK